MGRQRRQALPDLRLPRCRRLGHRAVAPVKSRFRRLGPSRSGRGAGLPAITGARSSVACHRPFAGRFHDAISHKVLRYCRDDDGGLRPGLSARPSLALSPVGLHVLVCAWPPDDPAARLLAGVASGRRRHSGFGVPAMAALVHPASVLCAGRWRHPPPTGSAWPVLSAEDHRFRR